MLVKIPMLLLKLLQHKVCVKSRYSFSDVAPAEAFLAPEVPPAQAQPVGIRESMVKNAIEFLQEPRVAPSPGSASL